ncbi:GDP-L-fucose synthase family protein [Cohnella caldifontis]|uniref:GDP-L-fucose synthase family protein n=1 Tax=Cohnella caldifontis TaxID=3027471 RepID=UPI0023ECDB54|nr:GDP-L-fucose synthase [Cohnella sp. YIM B05605]
MEELRGKKVLVTGGGGFLGTYVVERLQQSGCGDVIAPRSRECDLRDPEVCRRILKDRKPDIVIHLAAVYGGVEVNRRQIGRIYYENAAMGLHLMEAARQADVEKFVGCGSYAAYPRDAAVPFDEEDLWNGLPEDASAGYGLAKRTLLAQGQFYRRQYGFRAIHLVPAHLYGPRDRFDPASSNVVAALIRRCCEAARQGGDALTVWGSGKAAREFLYAEDAAEAFVLAAARYDGEKPVNIGTGIETPIRALAETIAETVGFRGRLEWDASKPDGHPRRCLDVRRAKTELGFEAKTGLAEGIRRTVAWYLEHRPV